MANKEYRLFPDIKLICGDTPAIAADGALEICCCVNGACEYVVGGERRYLAKDNVLVFKRGANSECKATRSNFFRGAFIIIYPGYSSTAFAELLDVPGLFREARENEARVYSADEKTREIVADICAVTEDASLTRVKMKSLELFTLLDGLWNADRCKNETIKRVGEFVAENVSERYTIPRLSKKFGVNPTTLKSGFKREFGCGVYDYAKKRKAFRAAELLLRTDMKIIDIAEEVGYSNSSKFASAFRKIMGVNPKRFRMNCKSASVKST